MLLLRITNKHVRQQLEHAQGPIEFGRGPQRGDVPRFVTPPDDQRVSRDHLRIEELPNNQVRLENLSQRNPVRLADNRTIPAQESCEVELPVRLSLGETLIEVFAGAVDPIRRDMLETVAQPLRGRSMLTPGVSPGLTLLRQGSTPTPETLAHWFETVIAVQRAAADSPEFYDLTARALVDLVGLDQGLVLLRRGDSWEVAAAGSKDQSPVRKFSATILKYVAQEARTFYQTVNPTSITKSLEGVESVVASPIFGSQDEVVGALYGSRLGIPLAGRSKAIGPLEAQLVQLLASAVGAGLARLEQEMKATSLRVQFEQFFSKDLAQELQRNPRLLDGQQRDVTLLFSDIRGFSRISERIGPVDTCKLVSAVMDRLTIRIREFEGVVVDYMGDGLLAMWNAPAHHPDHAVWACRAALAMSAEMPGLSQDWEKVVGGPLSIGIGLNTGPAIIGNTGSQFKFKYGPLGHTVNLASRVEGATKHFRIPILITGSTKSLLGDRFATRRLCKVRVVGISGAIDFYELHAESATPEWEAKRDGYEKALALYESSQWVETCRTIYPLLAGHEGHFDVPSLDLAGRALTCLKQPPEDFDPVVELASK